MSVRGINPGRNAHSMDLDTSMEENIGYDPRGYCTTNPQQHHPFIPKYGRR